MNNNEDIHIILCCWKRIDFLHLQLENLEKQTVSNRIHLHLINNNNERTKDIEEIINKYISIKINLTNYDNKYAGFQRFLYIKDFIIANYDTKFVIIIDDDQLFDEDWVEKLFNLQEYKTYIGWYGKIWDKDFDYWKDSIIKYLDVTNNLKPEITTFDYLGTGGSIIDISIFKESMIFELPKNLENIIYHCEDLWLSYLLKYEFKWQIKRSFLPEKESINKLSKKSDDCSLWKIMIKEKQVLFDYLINKYSL